MVSPMKTGVNHEWQSKRRDWIYFFEGPVEFFCLGISKRVAPQYYNQLFYCVPVTHRLCLIPLSFRPLELAVDNELVIGF